jgi:hypothetical protein
MQTGESRKHGKMPVLVALKSCIEDSAIENTEVPEKEFNRLRLDVPGALGGISPHNLPPAFFALSYFRDSNPRLCDAIGAVCAAAVRALPARWRPDGPSL